MRAEATVEEELEERLEALAEENEIPVMPEEDELEWLLELLGEA